MSSLAIGSSPASLCVRSSTPSISERSCSTAARIAADVFLRLRGQLAGDPALQELGEPADRGQRGAELVAHVGEEAGLDRVGLLERGVDARAARPRPSCCRSRRARSAGPLPSGSGTPANSSVRPSASCTRSPRCLRSSVAARTTSPIALALRRAREPAADLVEQRLDPADARRAVPRAGPRIGGKQPVPQLDAPVGREHRERLEQAVERRRCVRSSVSRTADSASCSERSSAISDQPAVGHRLGDDAQVRAVGLSVRGPRSSSRRRNHPVSSRRHAGKSRVSGNRPASRAVSRKRSNVERVEPRRRRQREDPLERLVGEGQPPLGVELRDPDRQLVEHRALRLAERAERAACSSISSMSIA